MRFLLKHIINDENGVCVCIQSVVLYFCMHARAYKNICSHGIEHACIYVDIRKDKDVCGGSEDVCGDSEHVSAGCIQDTATHPHTLTA